jgi:hypothetical protein
MMAFFYGYLVAGGLCVLFIYLSNRFYPVKPDDAGLSDLLENIKKQHATTLDRLLENVIVPAFMYPLLVLFWPVALVFAVKSRINAEKPLLHEEEELFEVKKHHLVQQVTVAEVEASAYIQDPLGAVPEVPFGHLNPVWEAFKTALETGDELWRFEANVPDWRGKKHPRRGLVIVRGEPGKFIYDLLGG